MEVPLAARHHAGMATTTYLPNDRRATIAIVACAVQIGATMLRTAAFVAWTTAAPGWGSRDDLEPIVVVTLLLDMLTLGALLFCGIAFVVWFRRAFGNAHALGLRSNYGPGWAIGGWFVPVLHLFRPVQLASEMWGHAGRERVGSAAILVLWWCCYVVSGFLTRTAMGWSTPGTAPDFAWLLFAGAAEVVGLGLAIVIVRRLTAAHAAMHVVDQAETFA
jgi:hypothetical protein